MTPKQFYSKVVMMRNAQKLYFKTRSPRALNDSKELEKEIDAEIERVKKIEAEKYKPKSLFD
ncbi:hypothetical protein [Porphyromonas levii]|uniref:hypothetical protein n=2 Tax=Porphyromonas levii TaxID=28114 RepID=UPI0003733F84|nr:hypothetical protein [Porphyromonas levii]MBR8712306.1 hypothetical protein [Porphyromonas levii]MBR8714227.1 hypothetical protein [Porphyromonas levii]MBR8726769.1 hypothetical protein [Porphyromonas levii]MBR8735074.1 hypothetical protein [Porphyromonas levii]MBR8777177.1 hypothetical protein [Porphyromonas levii]